MIGHHQSLRGDERCRAVRQPDRRQPDVIEPSLIRRKTIGPTPIVERWCVEGPHRAELSSVGGRRELSWLRGGLSGRDALTRGLTGYNEGGGERQPAQHGSTRQHFR